MEQAVILSRRYLYESPYNEPYFIILTNTMSMAWLNVILSWIGYFFFGYILYCCVKNGVFLKRSQDVFLILIFAFAFDLIEMRMHLFFIFELGEKTEKFAAWGSGFVPTTAGACTIALYLSFLNFFIIYVEAIVSIRRFVISFCRMLITFSFVYISIGIVFTIKLLYLFATFVWGEADSSSLICTRYYGLRYPFLASLFVWMLTLPIAPITSLLIIIRRQLKKDHDHQDSGISAMILTSSLSMAVLFVSFVLSSSYRQDPPWVLTAVNTVASTFQDFRILFQCILAVTFVSDIRGAVIASFSDFSRKHLPIVSDIRGAFTTIISRFTRESNIDSSTVSNGEFVDTKSPEKINVNRAEAVSLI
ncbi:hypothetical protein PENTCL1PPCAC_4081 [Pristionchus entomophagus]|uniref:G protein-coupled receptor n=1 Tax=Pristionchus entomophagus TaxID=358040 RepID=A0AAV5SQP9_9BILA|nr:hypothetical protein PENTCL1PPCAC_4081 [Pristionchus entomophagus]